MPIEIRELIIKASVDNQSSGASSGSTGGGKPSKMDIQEIADRVFDIIKEKTER